MFRAPAAGRWLRVVVPAGDGVAADGIVVRGDDGVLGTVRADGVGAASPGEATVVRRYVDALTGAPLPRDPDGAWLAAAGQRVRVLVDVPLADALEAPGGLVVIDPVPGAPRRPGHARGALATGRRRPGLVAARLDAAPGGVARLAYEAFAETRGRYVAPHSQALVDEARGLIKRGGEAVVQVR
ncbi:MAG: hypothetical protein H6745_02315 [Deltaproteobacteria bacterium]|nr:hypothetical protein [Deltaproteobacteria bacterium]